MSRSFTQLTPRRTNDAADARSAVSGIDQPPLVLCCRECALPQLVPPLQTGAIAECLRCSAMLRHSPGDPLNIVLALTLAASVFLAVGSATVIAVVQAIGQQRTAFLLSGPIALARSGLWELSVLVVFTTFIAPIASACLMLYTLLGLRLGKKLPFLRTAFAWRNGLRPWSMIEVFLVGYFVAYSKLGELVYILPGVGFYALFGFMILNSAADVSLDKHFVWEAIERLAPIKPSGAAARARTLHPEPTSCPTCALACLPTAAAAKCPRCNATLQHRKPASLARTAAMAMSALILYAPANFFPVLTVIRLDKGSPSTILSGVWELLGAGQAPLAIIVFVASVAVPVLKLLGLAAMLIVVTRSHSLHLRQLSSLYRVVAAIGRWSMIDIFMESILAALVQFGTAATISPGGGAIAFAAVVVFTMFAAESFDPRLMWDGATR